MNYKYIFKVETIDKEEQTKEYENITEIDIEDKDKYFEVAFKLDEERADRIENFFIKINNNFKVIQINKEDSSIYNIDKIIKGWKILKKEAILNIDIPAIVDLILDNAKFYENEEFLTTLLKNYNIMPFLFLLDFKDLSKSNCKNLKLYNLIFDSELNFDLSFNFEEEKSNKGILRFVGKEAKTFDTTPLRQIIKKEYNIAPGTPFSLELGIEGNYVLENNFIKSFKAVITIICPKVMKKIATFELLELKNE